MLDPEVLKMKVADLKRELKLRGLSTAGNKTDLQDRLHGALLDGELSLEDTAISGEDLLDDEVLTDEEEKAIFSQSDEHPLLLSPILESKSKTSESTDSDTVPVRKIILKRKSSIVTPPTISILTSKENTAPILEKVMKMSEKNPIVIDEKPKSLDADCITKKAIKVVPELTWQERLDLRAKKFGSLTETLKPVSKGSGSSDVNSEKQLEALKKRAERFGVVAPKMMNIKVAEKLQKRKERFGAGPTSDTSAEYAEKAKLRLDRFQPTTDK